MTAAYRRDHLRALAQRVEVADREVRIIGSKSNLLQTLTAAAGAKPTKPGVRRSVPKWRVLCQSPSGDVQS
jgi:site-specific DNA recombinase